MATRKKATAIVPTMLRMREELRRRIEREAKKNQRSLNSEMITRLEGSFEEPGEDARQDSQILKLLVGFSSQNGQMVQLVFHLMREMQGLDEADTLEMVNRMDGLLNKIKKTTTETESSNDA